MTSCTDGYCGSTFFISSIQMFWFVEVGVALNTATSPFSTFSACSASAELGDVKVIYTGPTTTTAEAQIDVLNGLIAQGVDAIAISANDPDAVVPVRGSGRAGVDHFDIT